jgi:molecular chaperone GrpE (heat shock protein)|tara:strand:- start:5 stop:673 length:669 start_codon:yes stop_codon:yes gene_type:complete
MSLDKKIISEIQRYKNINKYITEQALDAAAPPADPAADLGAMAPPPPADPAAAAPPAAPTPEAAPQPIDVANDPDVEKIDDDGKLEEKKDDEDEGSEELDVTDLVDSQKNIEQKQEEYFENLFGQLNKLESRLGEMDQIMSKLNTLEAKIEKYREKTPQEKLELRTYDSYPFNQKLSDFFDDKKEEMELTGKKDYVLTSDDVTDINANDVKKSFQPTEDDLM